MIRPENVPVTVDIIIEIEGEGIDDDIVLIERKNPPHGWALPGGFVEQNESLADAARREAKEETGLDVQLTAQLGAYSKPGRDPRGSVVSVAFVGRAKGTPKAADDAKNIKVVDPEQALKHIALAFDHYDVVWDYLNYRDEGDHAPVDR